jgi:biopolymer transport protein ExbB
MTRTRPGLACLLGLLALLGAGLAAAPPAPAQAPALPGAVAPPAAAVSATSGEPLLPAVQTSPPAAPRGGLLVFFIKGGVFMWPLLLSAILALAVSGERLYTMQSAHTDTRKLMAAVVASLRAKGAAGIDPALEICMRTRGPIAAILHAGLMKARRGPAAVEKAIETSGAVELAFLQRGLIVLSSIANLAPLLGFLGTVTGMIHAFEAIAAAEQVSSKVVANGIAEALITTLAGLVIAIPAQGAFNYFVSRIDRFVTEWEEAAIELLDALTDLHSWGPPA